jgi:transcriptional regulator with GAF, ATPase, and Fis domain
MIEAPAPEAGTSRLTNQSLEQIERQHILDVLLSTDGVIKGPAGAAVVLGMKPSTLYSKMEKLGIARK